MTAILSRESIKKAIKNGDIIFKGGDINVQIAEVSIDLTMSQHLWIHDYYFKTLSGSNLKQYEERKIKSVNVHGHKFWLFDITEPMILFPNIMYLVGIEQFVGASANSSLCMELKAKSTAARFGFDLIQANLFETGYTTRPCAEVLVLQPFSIQSGSCLTQVVFYKVEKQPDEILNYSLKNSYHPDGKTLDEVINEWTPERLLPNKLPPVFKYLSNKL